MSFALARTSFGAASTAVKDLQAALKNLSVKGNIPSADPGPLDGIVGPKTVGAVAAVVGLIPGIPDAVKTLLRLVPLAGYISQDLFTQAKNLIAQHAAKITLAIAAYSLKFGAGAPVPGGGVPGNAGSSAGKYPAGSIARFNRSRMMWSIYAPIVMSGVAGFGLIDLDRACMNGHCGLGETAPTVTPPPPAGYQKAGEEATQPAGTVNAGEEEDAKPWYKKPLVWAAIGVGFAGVGTGAYFLLRKKS